LEPPGEDNPARSSADPRSCKSVSDLTAFGVDFGRTGGLK
jgi:hypothetical protein